VFLSLQLNRLDLYYIETLFYAVMFKSEVHGCFYRDHKSQFHDRENKVFFCAKSGSAFAPIVFLDSEFSMILILK
jgi:hypothetical protein